MVWTIRECSLTITYERTVDVVICVFVQEFQCVLYSSIIFGVFLGLMIN